MGSGSIQTQLQSNINSSVYPFLFLLANVSDNLLKGQKECNKLYKSEIMGDLKYEKLTIIVTNLDKVAIIKGNLVMWPMQCITKVSSLAPSPWLHQLFAATEAFSSAICNHGARYRYLLSWSIWDVVQFVQLAWNCHSKTI